MKLTLYALASDTTKCGTEVELFRRKKDLHAALRAIMESDLDASADDSNAAREIRELIKDKSIATYRAC